MKNSIKLILFIVYTIVIFMIKDLRVFGLVFLVNCIVTILWKINFRGMFYHLKVFLPVILFTTVINIAFANWQEGILMGIRIFICYQITYLYSQTVSILEVADTIQKLCCPLKVAKVNTASIGMLVSISICMIPVLKNEIHSLMYAMKSKGKLFKIRNVTVIMKPLLISILRKTSEMEKALIARGL